MAALRIISVLVLLASCGCAMHTRPIVSPAKLTPVERNFQAVWDASCEVLRSYRFTVNQRDRRAGVIGTAPMAGKHFFEWWRRDQLTASGALENTVQPVYRDASVQINETEKGQYAPVVTVTVSRLMFKDDSERKISIYEMAATPSARDRWVIGVGCSDKTRPNPTRHSPGDEDFAREIAEGIRLLAKKKLTGG